MAITGFQHSTLWALDTDDNFSQSVTIQVAGVSALCEIALFSTWFFGDGSADAFIAQIVSASGVEEFPKFNVGNTVLFPAVFRHAVTSVTFRVNVYQAKAMARWFVYTWS